jgi:hypothetical protein
MSHHEPNDSLTDKLRMITWLLIGLSLYAAASYIGGFTVTVGAVPVAKYPIAQIVCQKLGNVTTFAWFGYQIARGALGRITSRSTAGDRQARAIVIGAAILAGALGI